MTPRRPAPDQAERDAAVRARGVNVVLDAGAGTGKTTTLVARLVELVAPRDGAEPVRLSRIAAVTFTRKAAGELRLKIRERLLEELASGDAGSRRHALLSAALGELDTAWVGTIHAFADRLLRLRPVEARLSPSYDVIEDVEPLAAEAFGFFMQAVETGTLAAQLPELDAALVARTEAAWTDAIAAGVLPETRHHGPYVEVPGLDRLFERLVLTRDVPPRVDEVRLPDLRRFGVLVDELAALAAPLGDDTRGAACLRAAAEKLGAIRDERDPLRILRALNALQRSLPRKLGRRDDFGGDDAGWRAWKSWKDGAPHRKTALEDDLVVPFHRWMAERLVAGAAVVVSAYEKVKARRGAADDVDLLLRLRDLLRDRRDVRAELQRLFDHVFVDEFQDTDPLQAEIVLYLCEQEATATGPDGVTLAPGKLTLVGDPKQSIYRFRRADVAVYAAVRERALRGGHLAKLTTSFRSPPGLVAWLDHRMDDLLGRAGETTQLFDAVAGTVVNEPLVSGRDEPVRPGVVIVPVAAAAGADGKEPLRDAEARALAAFVRRLVERGERTVADPATGERRPIRYGDVAILATATTALPRLFPALDRLGVPYSARGGTLLTGDALHRQLLLALRAIADRDDGVAQAALLRAPFFAVDLEDLARARAAPEDSTHEGVRRARAAAAIVRELRRRRLERPPGATARDLVERTGFGRAVALGPNGAQRLEAVRELCLRLDLLAAAEGLDYDAATARARAWAEDPVKLDQPRPVATEAVQVLTVHQAKGLEFPVVVLWDACAELAERERSVTWAVSRDGASWAVSLRGLRAEHPEGAGLVARERRYLDAERKRLVYVAATRARDLLVLPVAGETPNPRWVTGRLAAVEPDGLVERVEAYAADDEPSWAAEIRPPEPPEPRDADLLAAAVEAGWTAAAGEAARPRFSPRGVTATDAIRDRVVPRDERTAGPGAGEAVDGEGGGERRHRGRHGRVFGETVHLAIGHLLRDPRLGAEAAVERAARATGLAGLRGEAAADVARALAALEEAGLRRPPGADLRLEYPVAIARDGLLVAGYVDLLAADGETVTVLDFKTDRPPDGDPAASHAAYVAQVRAYAELAVALGLAAPGATRAGLLFTADGKIRWV